MRKKLRFVAALILMLAITCSGYLVYIEAACVEVDLSQSQSGNASTCPNGGPGAGFYSWNIDDIVTFNGGEKIVHTYSSGIPCTNSMGYNRIHGWYLDDSGGEPYYDVYCHELNAYTYPNSNPSQQTLTDFAQQCGCAKAHPSPILLAFDGQLKLTNVGDGVLFDIGNLGTKVRVGWPSADTDTQWLVRGTQVLDASSMFGDQNPQAPPTAEEEEKNYQNGYRALRLLDTNGDGLINANDTIWSELNLWRDVNMDGVSQIEELTPISARLTSLALDYQRIGRKQNDNLIRFKAEATLTTGKKIWSYDIYPAQAKFSELTDEQFRAALSKCEGSKVKEGE